jgi:TonB family protein
MCSVAQRVIVRLCFAVFLLVIPSTTKSQSTELILDRVDEGKLNLLASQTAQKIREAPVEEGHLSVLVIDFFHNSPGTSSRLGSLLADRFSESLGAYAAGLKIVDRKILKDYLTKEWTTLENLQSNDICLRIGRQLGATGVIVGTLSEAKDSVILTLHIEGLGPQATKEDLFPWRERTASLHLTEEVHAMLFQPGPNYARKADEIPDEPGIFRAGNSGVTSPICTYCPMPAYSEAARAAKLEGTVVLSVVVTAQGQVTSIYILKGAPLGLTAIAVNSAKQWRLTPAQKDGMPVSSRVEVETTFRLY